MTVTVYLKLSIILCALSMQQQVKYPWYPRLSLVSSALVRMCSISSNFQTAASGTAFMSNPAKCISSLVLKIVIQVPLIYITASMVQIGLTAVCIDRPKTRYLGYHQRISSLQISILTHFDLNSNPNNSCFQSTRSSQSSCPFYVSSPV